MLLGDPAWYYLLFPCPYDCDFLIVTLFPFLFIISALFILFTPEGIFSLYLSPLWEQDMRFRGRPYG